MKQLSPVKLIVSNSQEYYRMRTFWTKEPETIAFIMNLMEDGDTFYDVGACIGQYSLLAAYLYPKSKVYAFEPHINNYKRLIENVKLNKLDNITHMCVALSDHNGEEDFCIMQTETGTTGSQIYHLEAPKLKYKIQAITIDKLIETCDFPSHIKLDVDGTEMDIIKGMEQTLKDKRLKSVIVEFNERTEEMIQTFENNGFTKDNIYTAYSQMQKAFMYKSPDGKAKLIKKQPNIIFIRKDLYI